MRSTSSSSSSSSSSPSPLIALATLVLVCSPSSRGRAPGPPPDAAPDAAPACFGPGERCETGAGCCDGLTCWYLACVNHFVCTHDCSSAADCGDVEGACCKRPGMQTPVTVCVPGDFPENPALCAPDCGCPEGCAGGPSAR